MEGKNICHHNHSLFKASQSPSECHAACLINSDAENSKIQIFTYGGEIHHIDFEIPLTLTTISGHFMENPANNQSVNKIRLMSYE